MKTLTRILFCVAGALAIVFGITYWMSRPIFDGTLSAQLMQAQEIAPLREALTFSRTLSGDTWLVTDINESGIVGINLTPWLSATDGPTDAIDALEQIGQHKLRDIARSQRSVALTFGELGMPVIEHYPHIAAGTNYPAHAEEVGLDGTPFLFPKLSHTTVWNASVYDGARLDYEVEICAVPLANHSSEQAAQLGYVLCQDYTDRWQLVRHIDTSGPMGYTGFPVAKGGATRFPIGYLLLVPNDEQFYQHIEFSMYVNSKLRQQSIAERMVWTPREIMDKALADCQSPYKKHDEQVYLTGCSQIPARTFILTGTPEGVMFKVATVWNPFAYLRSGDSVYSFARYLGHMHNEIVDHAR